MSRDSAIDSDLAYFDEGIFQTELGDLVSYETESQNPDQAPELKRYLDRGDGAAPDAMGFACRLSR